MPLHATAAHLGAHFDLAAGRGGHGADCYVVNPLAELLATYPELMGLQRGA